MSLPLQPGGKTWPRFGVVTEDSQPLVEYASIHLGLAFGAITALALLAIVMFKLTWRSGGPARRTAMHMCLALFAVLYTLWGWELVFRNWISMSDGWHITYASREWREKHWRPVNSFGYRDREHSDSGFVGKRVLYVVGDSFAAGHGIANVHERFTDILAHQLGPAWKVVLIAQNGWNTIQELQAIRTYPKTPTAILLSYYINDIDAEPMTEQIAARFVRMPEGAMLRMVNSSHLVNFLYWRIRRGTLGDSYWNYLRNQYASVGEWTRHSAELLDIVNHAVERGIWLSVMIWPHLARIDESGMVTEQVARVFRAHGVPTMNLSETFAGRRSTDLVVNSLDVHPNAALHAEVAELWMDRVAGIYASRE